KVCVTRREPQPFAYDFLRHRKREDVEFAATDLHLAQTREILLKRFVIFVVAILFNDSYDSSLGYKPREIINVTVSVVAGNAIAEPENVADAEIIAQAFLDLIARKIGISILVQEAGLTREKSSAAVHSFEAA